MLACLPNTGAWILLRRFIKSHPTLVINFPKWVAFSIRKQKLHGNLQAWCGRSSVHFSCRPTSLRHYISTPAGRTSCPSTQIGAGQYVETLPKRVVGHMRKALCHKTDGVEPSQVILRIPAYSF